MTRVETGDVFVGEIPVSFFQGPSFGEKRYLDKAVEVVLHGIHALEVSPSESIRICTGYVLSKVRREVGKRGYRVEPARIAGRTQELAEAAFTRGLEQMGLSSVSVNAGKRSFSNQLRWVHEDLATRERHVKTGWSSWTKRLRWDSDDRSKSKK